MKQNPKEAEETVQLAQQLLDAVKAAPLETVRQIADPMFDADASTAASEAARNINSLRKIAGAGNKDAILFLVELGNVITTTLTNLVSAADAKEADDPPTSVAEDTHEDQLSQNANSKFASAMQEWLEHAQMHNLANADPHFWVGNPSEDKEQQERTVSHPLSRGELNLRSGLMESLREDFGQKLYLDAVHHVKEIAKNSWHWPISVRAGDLHTNRSLKEIMPALNLASSVERGFTAPSRGSGTPIAVAKFFYIQLELQRAFPRTECRLKAWYDQEKDDNASDRFDKLFNVRISPPVGLRKLPLLRVEWQGLDDRPDWNRENIWVRKAALLEPLCPSNIEKWVDAACYCLAARVGGDSTKLYEDYKNIEMRVRLTGSLHAGMNRFFREGFRALAK